MVITRPALTALVVCLVGGCSLLAKVSPPVKAKQAASKARTTTKKGKVPLKRASFSKKQAASRNPAAPAAPSSDRIREVQQALADRGYLKTPASGQWNADSVDALKRFETDQNVKVDGKIDSKVLIALGLGPKYDSNLSLPVPGASGGVVSADHNLNDQQR